MHPNQTQVFSLFIADLHIHSKYSRATSRDCVPEMLDLWARRKGLDLIGTGDFTHPVWREELKEKLVPAEEGLFALKDEFRQPDQIAGDPKSPRFLLTSEISSIYKKNGKTRKVHNLILLPDFESADALSKKLETIGNIHSDGRPILGLDSRDLLEITLDACPEAIFIPAHIWTPHFSVFGAYSGFDTIEECYEDLTGNIHALETGLSTDPPMNWRWSALDRYTLVSNSDAHSPGHLAREANLFNTECTYSHISKALQNRDTDEFAGTIEFFPQEGKYHYDGHRNCNICMKPSETDAVSGICPVCGRKITFGVLHRIESLADRPEGFVLPSARPFESVIPLKEVIAAASRLTPASKKVEESYYKLLHDLGPEFYILREAPVEDIRHKAGALVAEGIRRIRAGEVIVHPGFDGEYGKVELWDEREFSRLSGQLCLFGDQPDAAPVKPAKQNIPVKSPQAPAEPTAAENRSFGLNPEQQEAVCAGDGAVAVIAGPGTGKTRTLVSRIVRLVRECGVSPSQITAVTFTNRAANEMHTRLDAALGDKRAARAMHIGTFHSICLKLLAGQKSPEILDRQDALSVLADILDDLDSKAAPKDVLKTISLVKSGALPAEEADLPENVYDRYCARLSQYGALDYDDILLKALALFEDGALTDREEQKLRTGFTYLLVDEFQDINPVQYRLIRAWGRDSAGIFVIGDPDQSIYGFRGSDSRCFDRFFADFPEVKKICLTQNYRSTPEIIKCAESVLTEQSAAKPPLAAHRDGGVKVRLLEAESDLSEGIFIAKEIDRMVGGIDMLGAHSTVQNTPEQTRGFSDIALLYRTNHQAELLEQCLQKEGIPYLIAGRDEFLSDGEVRKAVAFFRFLLDPSDLISLRLCLKAWDICPNDRTQRLLDDYDKTDQNIASLLNLIEQLPPSLGNRQKFTELIAEYEPLVRREKPQKLLESWISDNALDDVQNMQLFLNMAVLHEKMPELLQNLLLVRESDMVCSGTKRYAADAVSLMTLHAAKGLEFPVVFVTGVKDGCIPLKTRGTCDEAEERRLLYVGMTRARDELVLLTSPAYSPFLSKLPEDLFTKGVTLERKPAPEFEQIRFF